MKIAASVLALSLSFSAWAADDVIAWQSAYIASGTKSAIIKLLPDNYDEVGPLIHSLAVINTKDTLETLIDLSDYYLGASNGEDYFALVVNKGEVVRPLIESKLKKRSDCLENKGCRSEEERNELLSELLLLIKQGKKIELVP